MLVAAKPMEMPDGSRVMPGDPIPSAAGWSNLPAYINQGYVLVVPPGLSLEEHAPETQNRIVQCQMVEALQASGVLKGGKKAKAPDPDPVVEIIEHVDEPAESAKPKGRKAKAK